MEVLPNRVTILASDALKPEEIDVPRAEQQLDRGEKMWKEAGESEEAYDEALRVISEAEAKILRPAKSIRRTNPESAVPRSAQSPAPGAGLFSCARPLAVVIPDLSAL